MEGDLERGGREPRRAAVASYDSYGEAQRAVDYLSDEGFPVQRVAIVAEDLKMVERVTGRRGYGQAALSGALSGALVGAFVGIFLRLFNLANPAALFVPFVLYGLVLGAILGAVFGLISHAATGGRRDFSSVSGMEAGRYEVMADEEVAEEAARLLADLRTRPQAR